MKIIAAVGLCACALAAATPAHAQEFALKGGAALSSFEIEGDSRFTESFLGTSYGGHYRLKVGPVWLQPEVNVITKGGRHEPADGTEERLRLEYLELPLLLVLPARVASFEPYAFGGPLLALETRCRLILEQEGLKTNLGCDSPRPGLFDRRSFDYGATAGAGIGHRLGSGKLLLEARYSLGLRDISDDDEDLLEVRNRTLVISLGYTLDIRQQR